MVGGIVDYTVGGGGGSGGTRNRYDCARTPSLKREKGLSVCFCFLTVTFVGAAREGYKSVGEF